jgi:arabinan endo-1,5-alpha-L-arabinosidase
MKEEFSAFPYDGFVPENGTNVHDPDVIDFNGHYICFCTSGNGFGLVRTSTDLLHWKVHGPIMRDTPEWLKQEIPMHRSIWAPQAIRYGKGLRLYYCASQAFGHNTSWIGVAECPNFDPENPTEGWSDLGEIIASKDGVDNFNAIDPSVLAGPDGRYWMYFGSYWSGLYVVEIDPITGKLKNPAEPGKKLIACHPQDRANGLEAPTALYKDGFYYLFVSYGLAAQGVRSTYQVVLGRSKDPDGPFVDSKGESMVEGGHEDFLNSSSPMFGPGGGEVTQDRNGRWLMSHHYYDGRAFWHGHVWGLPTLQVREIVWGKDGWPGPGLPVTPETIEFSKRPEKSPVGKWVQQADFGAIGSLEIRADGTCVLDEKTHGTWSVAGDDLSFKWPRVDEPGEFWNDEVKLASGGHYFVGRNQNRLVIRGVRQERS